MNMLEAIKSRRSLPCLAGKSVPAAMIADLIDWATYAPQHKKTNPWRFAVFHDDGKAKLAEAWAAGTDKSLDFTTSKVQRAPVIVAVWCAVGRSGQTLPAWEEEAAVAAAIQNMLLAAYAHGLAGFWRTGSVVDVPAVQALLAGFDATRGDKIMGLVYLGWPDEAKPVPERDIQPPQVQWY